MIQSPVSSLRSRLILLVFLAVIPALILMVFSAVEQRQIFNAEIESEAQRLTSMLAAEQARRIEDAHQLLHTLAQFQEINRGSPEACQTLLDRLWMQYPQYLNIRLLQPNGRLVCSAKTSESSDAFGDPAILADVINNRSFAVGGYAIEPISQSPSAQFAYPIQNASGEIQFILIADLDLQSLNRTIAAIQIPEGAAILLLDHNHRVLAHAPNWEKWVGQVIPADSPLHIQNIPEDRSVMAVGLDGVSRKYLFRSIEGSTGDDYRLGIGIDEKYVTFQFDQFLNRQLLGMGVVVILALTAAWFGGEFFILRRINSLLKATKKLANGDLDARTNLPYGRGEISQLARSFDQMADVLREREMDRIQAENQILRHNRDLEALNTITAAVSSSLELPEILTHLRNLLAEQLNVPGGALFFYDAIEDCLSIEMAWGIPASVLSDFKRFPAERPYYKTVVKEKSAFLEIDLRYNTPYAGLKLGDARTDWKSYLSVPLLAKGEIQGVLDLFSQAPTIFGQDHVSLFNTLGLQVGIAIHNARLFEQIRASRRRLQNLSQQFLEVQEAERRHIARELHDEIGQALTALKVNLQSAQRLRGKLTPKNQIEESIVIVERTLQQVRDLSLDLRPSLLDDLGIVSALRWYIDRQAQRAGFDAQFTSSIKAARLPSDLETTCFRVVQEALTNVVRHAKAEHVQITLNQLDESIELTIKDDGIGFDVDAISERAAGDLSLGLLGMQERVQLVGGKIYIQSNFSRGTEILAYFPLNRSRNSFSYPGD